MITVLINILTSVLFLMLVLMLLSAVVFLVVRNLQEDEKDAHISQHLPTSLRVGKGWRLK